MSRYFSVYEGLFYARHWRLRSEVWIFHPILPWHGKCLLVREQPRTKQIYLPVELLCVKGCQPPALLQHRGTDSVFLVRTQQPASLCISSEKGVGPAETA